MPTLLFIDGGLFEERIRPALTAGWRQRSFGPCRELCRELLPRVRLYHERYHIAEGESLLERTADHLTFARPFWYALVGQLCLYAAEETLELPACLDTLAQLAGLWFAEAHNGTRPLTFGLAAYRPERCGFNSRQDVERLNGLLAALDPQSWSISMLASVEAEERADELAFAQGCCLTLRDHFRHAREAGRVIVHEL